MAKQIFKTATILTALFLAFVAFFPAVSALTGSFTIYSGGKEVATGTQTVSIPVGQGYLVSVIGTCGVNCDNIIMRLYENEQIVEWPSPGNINRSCAVVKPSLACSLQWNFTKNVEGSFRYKAMIGNYGKEPGIVVNGPTITVQAPTAPLPPPSSSTLSGTLSVSSDNVQVGKNYFVIVRATRSGSGILYIKLLENNEALESKEACANDAADTTCSDAVWNISAKTAPGIFTYKAIISYGAVSSIETTPKTVTVTSVTTPITPPGHIVPIVIPNPLTVTSFEDLLNAIMGFIFWIGIAIAPVILIIAGFLYVTSVGNPQMIEKAKTMILYTIIGLVVLLLATGLVEVVKSVIGVK